MYNIADQITAANKTNLDTTMALATKTLAGFEKLVELNMAAAKALTTEAIEHAKSLLSAKDLQQAVALQTSLIAPMAEKSVSYGRHAYGIAVETGAQYTKAAEVKAAEAQKAFSQVIENVAKNAPAGSESAVAVLKSAVASSQNAIESAQSSAKQALLMAESNMAVVTEQALNAAATVSKKV
ncbi:MAG: Phasin (PHA-granule associated protein) [Comamonadaceae bacterium CG_4_9_14_3_um_filter_60_33]|nr:MAG: Phasin (PHA-granule associated protein) [Comamonadaceae bacterium CG_4_10_14_3_um_filter_60_42]PJB41838.1 MAG: Phasin (PHA-granule associated protein) [Comamonadaceae bacterium CG_4_9_14_3_um_filter_60_33]